MTRNAAAKRRNRTNRRPVNPDISYSCPDKTKLEKTFHYACTAVRGCTIRSKFMSCSRLPFKQHAHRHSHLNFLELRRRAYALDHICHSVDFVAPRVQPACSRQPDSPAAGCRVDRAHRQLDHRPQNRRLSSCDPESERHCPAKLPGISFATKTRPNQFEIFPPFSSASRLNPLSSNTI